MDLHQIFGENKASRLGSSDANRGPIISGVMEHLADSYDPTEPTHFKGKQETEDVSRFGISSAASTANTLQALPLKSAASGHTRRFQPPSYGLL